MNRTTLRIVCIAGFALVAASCSQGGTTTNPGGGTPQGGTTGAAGTTSPGSTISTGGTTQPGDTGGTSAADTGGVAETGGSAGGETSAGGTTGAAGSISTGGATKSGGTTGAAGSISTGGSTSAGGTTKAGSSSSAGGSTSAGGTTGAAGTSGAAGGGASIPPETIVPQMNGFLWVGTCSPGEVGAGSLDCYLYPEGTASCPNATSPTYANKGVIRTVTQTVGGTAGTPYTINFEIRGVLGSKCYSGGTRRAGDAPPAGWNAETNTDGWYEGGTPATGLWNTYEIHVTPPVLTETKSLSADKTENIYYLNSMPSTMGVTWCEVHETFPIQYKASFPVFGGGTIKFVLHDSNCKGQQNCGGPTPANCTTQHRTVDLTGMPTPLQTPPSPQQPYKDSNGHYPQWALFDVTSVTSP